ncbi:MAG TPA: FMN-binding protein [Candidatus Paceibacterota bacterium]
MKKISFSVGLVLTSAFYVLFSSQGTSSVIAPAITPVTANNNPQVASSAFLNNPVPAGGTPVPTPTPSSPAPIATTPAPKAVPPTTPVSPTPPTPAPAPTPKPAGLYTDGTYTGSPADAYYGNVQVEAIISGGKITDVQFLQYPNTHSTSVYINSQAMPYLKQEAIQAQSANVNIVSGATDTSMAFQQSLASALTQAKS